jgi:sugar transferase (PEP-CTERM/EpsH1 system associated)
VKILWLKSDLLFPLDKGGKLRTWHLMRHLAKHHSITYLAFARPDEDQEAIDRMREVADRVELIPRTDAAKRSLKFYAGAAWHLLDPLPYAIGKYRSRAFRRRIEDLIRSQAFDVIVSDFVLPAVNLPRQVPCPVVIFTHNVEAEIWRRYAETHRGRLSGLLYAGQHRRMLRFERRALAAADGVLAVSEADQRTLAELYPGAIKNPVRVVSTGVDTDYFRPSPAVCAPASLVFTGSMDWLPNEDAMVWFCREVLPRIRAREPGTTLTIVGRTPTPPVVRLGHEPGIDVTGRVDDVRRYVAKASLYIVPLRIGGGTRLKIFEAMAMGKAVVSTTVGAEGLPVRDGEHLALADDAEGFADTVLALMRDDRRRHALEDAARTLVVDHYDWSAVAGELERALIEFSQRRPSGAPGQVRTLARAESAAAKAR